MIILKENTIKKILIFLIISVIVISFTFNAFASTPPRLITVESIEELLELRKSFGASGELEALLVALDSLPIPVISDKELLLRTITYNPDIKMITTISYDSEDGYFYSFSIRDYRPETVEEFIERVYNEKSILLYQSEDENIKIYAYPQALRAEVLPGYENNSGRFVMDFYGYFVWVIYWHENITDYSSVDAEQLLGEVAFSSMKELETMHEQRVRFQKGDVNGDGKIDTTDALEILKYEAGLLSAIN